jgi:protein phosphatase
LYGWGGTVSSCNHEVVDSGDTARKRFGILEGEIGVCYTRTGRRFFNNASLECQFLERVRSAVERAGIWESLKTDWVCLDCELMPWSAKAQELLRQQYATTGAAARAALPAAIAALSQTQQIPEAAAKATNSAAKQLSDT